MKMPLSISSWLTGMKKPYSISWWLTGPEYWAAMLHDEKGNLIRLDTGTDIITGATGAKDYKTALRVAEQGVRKLADHYGVDHLQIWPDENTRSLFAEYQEIDDAKSDDPVVA